MPAFSSPYRNLDYSLVNALSRIQLTQNFYLGAQPGFPLQESSLAACTNPPRRAAGFSLQSLARFVHAMRFLKFSLARLRNAAGTT
jgi:hypothetical protein